MKPKPIFATFFAIVVLFSVFSCSKDDRSSGQLPGSNAQHQKEMRVEISYSGDFSKGFFVISFAGLRIKGDNPYVSPLIDEQTNKSLNGITLSSNESTQSQTLNFHSTDKIDGINFACKVDTYDDLDKSDIKVHIKVYAEDKLIDDRTLTDLESSTQVNYTIAATGK